MRRPTIHNLCFRTLENLQQVLHYGKSRKSLHLKVMALPHNRTISLLRCRYWKYTHSNIYFRISNVGTFYHFVKSINRSKKQNDDKELTITVT